jgi:hypothetical protein
MMRTTGFVVFGLAIMAALQSVAAFELLAWADPLFGDPPILGNGAARAADHLRELSQQNPEGFRYIPNIDRTFIWLFHRHSEGVLLCLVAGLAFAFSATVNIVFLLLLLRARRIKQSAVN